MKKKKQKDDVSGKCHKDDSKKGKENDKIEEDEIREKKLK